MQVGVRHGLPACGPVGLQHRDAFGPEFRLHHPRNLPGRAHHGGCRVFVHVHQRFKRLFARHNHMAVVHLARVHEGKHVCVFVHLGARQFAAEQAFKNGGHGLSPID